MRKLEKNKTYTLCNGTSITVMKFVSLSSLGDDNEEYSFALCSDGRNRWGNGSGISSVMTGRVVDLRHDAEQFNIDWSKEIMADKPVQLSLL